MTGFLWKRTRASAQAETAPYAGVPVLQELRPLYESELRRARRYKRPLSVMVLRIDAHSRAGTPSPQCVALGHLLQDVLRETDLLGCIAATEEYVLLLPEADAFAANEAGARLRRLWSLRQAGVKLKVGIAAYPGAGLVLDDLIGAARGAALAPEPLFQRAGRAHDIARG